MLLDDIRTERLRKIALMREKGMDPYPAGSARTHTGARFLAQHDELAASGASVALAGRVMSMREHGGSLFIDLFDGTERVQAYLKQDDMGAAYDDFVAFVDLGDIIEVRGIAFTTKRGMKSLLASSWTMLAKALRPLPDEWYGIKDEDERYRKRYIDMLLSRDIAERVKRKSAFWNTCRRFLLDRGFVEVETPVLETTTGGAEARPFITHHNALDMEVYLRISAGELWQKRLMVAGLPKVFEIGRIFRNEGMSNEHLQDYTQLEFYEAYEDYRHGMRMITELYRAIADGVYGTRQFSIRGFDVDFDKEWETYDFSQLIMDAYGVDPRDITPASDVSALLEILDREGIAYETGVGAERCVDLL